MNHIRKLNASRSYRVESGEFAAEGGKMLAEALSSGAGVRAVLHTGEAALPPMPDGVRVETVGEAIIKSVSDVKTPQGIVFICEMKHSPASVEKGRYIVLDGVRDPGNVGTVLRTAEAFEMDGVIFTGDCADPYNPKVVRGSMGAVFRQRFFAMERDELVRSVRSAGLPLYAAAGGASRLLTELEAGPCAFVIGNEGAGVSRELLDGADERVMIPMGGKCESLNAAVAASVIMWELYSGERFKKDI